MKTVSIVAHAFDCLPGHVTITARGSGGNLRVAVSRAVQDVMSDDRLKWKKVSDFKMSVVVISDKKVNDRDKT